MSGGAELGPRADVRAAAVLDDLVFDELRESLASRPGALADVYRKFLQSATASINALRAQDAPTRISTVHTLKGSAAMLGGNRLSALAAQLQSHPEHLAGSAIEAAAGQLSEELMAFRRQVNAQFALLGQQEP